MAQSNTNHAQYGFNGGELSPKLEMRDDVALRKLGLDYCENWLLHLQGPMSTAAGWEFVYQVSDTYGRVFPFYVNTHTGFLILITPDTIRLSDSNGIVSSGNQVENGDFNDGGANWTVDESGNGNVVFDGGSCSFQPGNNAAVAIYQNVQVTPNENNRLTITVASGAGELDVYVGTSNWGGEILSMQRVTGTDNIIFEDLVSPTGDFWVTLNVSGGQPDKVISQVDVQNTDAPVGDVSFPSPWADSSAIFQIQAMMAPGTLDLFFVGGGIAPQILSYDPSTSAWTFGDAPLTNVPGDWTGSNWPRVIDFWQGRLYLASTPSNPEDFWGSRPGSSEGTTADTTTWERYQDFLLVGTSGDADLVTPSHAIHYTLDKRGEIRWMVSANKMIMGTENAEWILTSSTGLVVPGDIQADIQSTFGSAVGQATIVGNEVMFISIDRLKIRRIGFEWSKTQWTTKDVTFFAEHITGEGNRLARIVSTSNPTSLIMCSTALGSMVGCVYDTETNNGGFFRRTTLGEVNDMCILPSGGIDEMWILVERDDQMTIEKVVAGDHTKLDSRIHLTSETPTYDWVAPHLAGQECQLLVDGAVHPPVTPDLADGSFTTQEESTDVVIGLQILSTARTMSLGNQVQFMGTTRPMLKRWAKLFARITASWKPLLNGKRPPNRHPATPMGEMEPARTETVQVSNLGWDLDGRIEIVQDEPVYTEVAGLFGNLTRDQA